MLQGHLPAALDDLSRRAALPVRLDVAISDRLPEQVEGAAYFVASEALTNAAKHSHAREVRLGAFFDRAILVVEVSDDGVGALELAADRAFVASPTASRRSAAGSPSRARRAAARLRAEIPCV